MLDIFKCIKCGEKLNLKDIENSNIVICEKCNSEFQKVNEIFTFLENIDNDKVKQTMKAFGYQWNTFEFGHNEGSKKYSKELFFDRYAINSDEELKSFIENKIVYDPAVGSGRVEHIFSKFVKDIYVSDMSTAIYPAKKNWEHRENIHFFRADLLNPPFIDEAFDCVICHAILQHTKDAFSGLKSLVRVLKKDGLIFFDVYRKAAPIRDFGDDFIRDIVSDLPEKEAYEKLKPLTKLAKELYKHKIDVPEDIDFLEIKKGEYNLQRFVYYKLLKLFWNDSMSFEDNHAVTFDWFYPKLAKRYTSSEVKEWLSELNLEIVRYVELEGGIGVIARKIDV